MVRTARWVEALRGVQKLVGIKISTSTVATSSKSPRCGNLEGAAAKLLVAGWPGGRGPGIKACQPRWSRELFLIRMADFAKGACQVCGARLRSVLHSVEGLARLGLVNDSVCQAVGTAKRAIADESLHLQSAIRLSSAVDKMGSNCPTQS